PRGERMRMRTRLALLALPALLACSKKPQPPGATPAPTLATLAGQGYTVQVAASPFRIQVLDASGALKLETAGGPMATYNIPTYETQIVPGWDGYRANERPWVTATSGTLSADAHTATVQLQAEGKAFTVTVTADGPRVRIRQG